MSDLDQLREIGLRVRQPDFDEVLETHRRRTVRARVATASALAMVVAVAAGVVAVAGNDARTEPPPVAPSPSPAPTRDALPTAQRTVVADVRPGDVRGFEVLATVTNTQPAHRGATSLTTTVTGHVDAEHVAYDCRAHRVPTWVAHADGDLVSDSPGGATDGWTYQPCRAAGRLSLELRDDLPESSLRLGKERKTVRMFAMAPPSAAMRECIAHPPDDGCQLRPVPLDATDAEFGFRIYDDPPAPWVLRLPDVAQNDEPLALEALSSVGGRAWLVDRAVVADAGAARLALDLPGSDQDALVDVYVGVGRHFEQCRSAHVRDLPDWESTDHNVYEAALDEVCGADLRLSVDGTTVRRDRDPYAHGHFTELGTLVPAGAARRVEVRVVRGDSRNIRYALVVRVPTRMP